MLNLQLLIIDKERQWDEFVKKQVGSRFSFLTGFKKAVEETFGYQAQYFIFERDGQIAAIWPCFLAGKKLISIPFGVYGGILGNVLVEDETIAVIEEIKKQYPHIKIIGEKQELLEGAGFYKAVTQKFGILALDTPENLWNNKLDRSAKKNIKRAEREALESFCDNSVDSIRKYFYPLYLAEMKRFGTPPYPLKFFLKIVEHLAEKARIVYVKNRTGEIISALFGIGGGDTFYIHFNPSNPQFNELRGNDLAHWHLINLAHREGYKYFDFGPMRYSGQIQFKRKWGVEERDYYVYSTEAISSKESKAQRLVAFVWQRFMPNFLARKIGPIIRKKLAH